MTSRFAVLPALLIGLFATLAAPLAARAGDPVPPEANASNFVDSGYFR